MNTHHTDPSLTPVSLSPPLDEFLRQLEVLKAAGRELAEDLSEAGFHWTPDPRRWSIGQCYAHLNTTADLYVPRIEEGIAEARRRRLTGTGPAHWGPLERWFIRQMEPPPRRRLPAPPAFQPPAEGTRDEILARFLAAKERYIELLHAADGLDLRRARMRSPLSRFLRFRIGAAFATINAHERRHLWQARQVRALPDFPAE